MINLSFSSSFFPLFGGGRGNWCIGCVYMLRKQLRLDAKCGHQNSIFRLFFLSLLDYKFAVPGKLLLIRINTLCLTKC